jgi:nitrogen fixation protein NifU and related proteins
VSLTSFFRAGKKLVSFTLTPPILLNMPGLEDLYREIILDHYKSPRNRGELPSPPAVRKEGKNPTCGDEILVYVMVDGDGDTATVTDVKISGHGCSISQSSASMMTVAVKGKTVAEARRTISAFLAILGIRDDKSDIEADQDSTDGAGPAGPAPGNPVNLGDLEALQGVMKFPVRIKCATLAWFTLRQGLDTP